MRGPLLASSESGLRQGEPLFLKGIRSGNTDRVNVPTTLLGLIEPEPSHGYELKQAYDTLFGGGKPLSFGQVYGTLARLERDGHIAVQGAEPGEGPDRKRYVITRTGVSHLEQWLSTPEAPEPALQPVLFAKVVLAVLSDRPAADYLDAQRSAHLARMRELTAVRKAGPLRRTLVADYGLFHLEADLRWIDLTAARLNELRAELRAGQPTDPRTEPALRRSRRDRP
jgi:DNA-binding PadR family transcriptional regulator